jgi:hypothetical protein
MRRAPIFAICNVGAALLAIWAADRNPATETVSVTITPAVVPAGGDAEVRYVYQRFRLCNRRSVQQVADVRGRTFEIGETESPPYVGRVQGTAGTFVQPFRVPLAAQPGAAVYRVDIRDYCNPIHRLWPIHKTIEAPFTIAP